VLLILVMEDKKNNEALSKIVSFSARFRIPIILVVVLLTILFAFFAVGKPGIGFNSDLRSLITPAEGSNKYNKERADSEFLVVAVKAPKGSEELFTEKTLADLQRAIGEINKLDNLKVAVSPFEQIKITPSIRNGKVTSYKPLPILKKDYKSETPFILNGKEDIENFKQELLRNSFTRRLVINDNATMLAFMIDHSNFHDSKILPDLISNLLDKYSDSFSYNIAGSAYFEKFAAEYLRSDLGLLMGLGLLLSLILFFFSFRSLRAVFLPASVVILSIIWMLGTMALLGMNITIVSIVGPPLILALGSSYCIHVLNQYYRDATDTPDLIKPVIVFKAISKINKTILMASATTVIALLGLLLAKISQTRTFAIATSIGIIYSSLLSLVYLPATLSLLKLPSEKRKRSIKHGFISNSLRKFAPWIIKRRFFILVIFIIIILSPIVSSRFMSYESDYITYFPDDNPAVVQTSTISKELSGITQLYIDYHIDEDKFKKYIEKKGVELGIDPSTAANFYHDYNALQTIADFEIELKKNENIRYMLSFPLILCETNKVVSGSYSIPTEFSQRFKLNSVFNVLRARRSNQFELILPRADTISTGFRLADLSNSHGYIKEADLEVFLKDLNNKLETILPEYIDYQVGGHRVDFIKLRQTMNRDLQVTTIFSVILIFLSLSLLFRNAAYGFYSLIPMLSGITLNFTIMAIARIPLDMTTVMVSSVAIGIGVDDSVHFLLKFNALYEEFKDRENRFQLALQKTLEITGRPIVLTSISIILGMGMMVFASFTPIAYFGFLVALALLTTTIGCLVFLPMTLTLHYRFKDKKQIRKDKKKA